MGKESYLSLFSRLFYDAVNNKITLSDDKITDILYGIRKETVMEFAWTD